jgi:hypothetical protein
MITSYLERYLRDICRRLSIPTRDQDILIDRISKHRTYHWLSLKYGISLTRLNQIVRRFWHRLWVGTMAFGKFCKEENELIKELKRIRLYRNNNGRPIDTENGKRSVSQPESGQNMHQRDKRHSFVLRIFAQIRGYLIHLGTDIIFETVQKTYGFYSSSGSSFGETNTRIVRGSYGTF